MEKRKSNKEIGEESLAKLDAWLTAAERIPERNGKANLSAIALSSGVDRQVLYRKAAQAMIKAAADQKGLGMPAQMRQADGELPQWAKQRMHQLEQRLASLYAELADLRKKVTRFEHMERHMSSTGSLPR